MRGPDLKWPELVSLEEKINTQTQEARSTATLKITDGLKVIRRVARLPPFPRPRLSCQHMSAPSAACHRQLVQSVVT